MKKIIIFSFLILLSLIFSRCDDDSTSPSGNLKYPAKLGNEWEYMTTMEFIFYDSTGNIYGNDTLLIGNTIAEVIEEDATLGDITDLTVISSYDLHTPQNLNYIWYYNNEATLTAVAYSGPGSSQPILPKSINNYGNNYLMEFIKNTITPLFNIDSKSFFEDSLQYYDPQRKVLEYPLVVGRSWTQTISPFTFKRTVINKKTIETSAGNFNCYVIKTEIKDFPNVSLDDYINLDVGLILRKTKVDSMVQTTAEGDTIGFYNTTSFSELIRRE